MGKRKCQSEQACPQTLINGKRQRTIVTRSVSKRTEVASERRSLSANDRIIKKNVSCQEQMAKYPLTLEELAFLQSPYERLPSSGLTRLPYRYRRLPNKRTAFRLLKLLPGKALDPIRCELFIERIENSHMYEAISYAWGDPEDTTEVSCNGRLLKITKTLAAALQRFRHEVRPRVLWADAICINQQDSREQGHQVSIMGFIYKRASKVLVWLGRGSYIDVHTVVRLVDSLAEKVTRRNLHRTPETERDLWDSMENVLPQEWEALRSVLEYPWFHRVWVLQEVGLAAEASLFCGDAEMPWEDFALVCEFLHLRYNVARTRYRLLVSSPAQMTRIGFKNAEDQHILTVLYRARYFLARDPRDMIFALLAHPAFERQRRRENLETFVPVDYEAPYQDTYLAVAKRLLELTRRPLDMLSSVYHTFQTMADSKCISWVPQWNVQLHAQTFGCAKYSSYYASGNTEPDLSVQEHVLELRGLCIDVVEWHSEVIHNNPLSSTYRDSRTGAINPMVAIWSRVRAICTEARFANEALLLETFCNTLTAGEIMHASQDKPTVTKRLADLAAYFEEIGAFAPQINSRLFHGGGNYESFVNAAERPCRDRRFFITKQGYFGLGPGVMTVGDQVCVFFGGQVPFIIRKHLGINEKYRLCGECYVHGLMHGEAIDMFENGDIQEETFKLV